MSITVRQALELEAAIHLDALLADLDALLRAVRASLWLGWHGKWAELAVKFESDEEPRTFLRLCKKWPHTMPKLDDARAADFWDRLQGVLELHCADIGLGFTAGGTVRCQVALPHAPKFKPTDRDFAGRLLITTRGRSDVREVEL